MELHHPPDLTAAMSLARLYERRNDKGKDEAIPIRRNIGVSTGVGAPKTPYIKRLSRVEIEERRAKGLCFNCDE